jgi:hypothetical protein
MVATKATSKDEINDASCNAFKAVAHAYMGRFGNFDDTDGTFDGKADSGADDDFIQDLTDNLNDDVFMKSITTVTIPDPSLPPGGSSSTLSSEDEKFLIDNAISEIKDISTHELYQKDPDQLYVYYIPVKTDAGADDKIVFSFNAEQKDGKPYFQRDQLELNSTLTDEYNKYKEHVTNQPQFTHIQTWVKGQAIVNHKIGKSASSPTGPPTGPPIGDRTGIEELSYQAQYHNASEYFKNLASSEFDTSTYSEIFWSPSTHKFVIVGKGGSGNVKKITMKYDVDSGNFLTFNYKNSSLIEVSAYDEPTDKGTDSKSLNDLLDELQKQTKQDSYKEVENNGYLEYLRQIKEATKTVTLSEGEQYRRNAEAIEKVPRVLELALHESFTDNFNNLSTTKRPTQKSQRLLLQKMLKEKVVTAEEFDALNVLAFKICENPAMYLNTAEIQEILNKQTISSTATTNDNKILDINNWWAAQVNRI